MEYMQDTLLMYISAIMLADAAGCNAMAFWSGAAAVLGACACSDGMPQFGLAFDPGAGGALSGPCRVAAVAANGAAWGGCMALSAADATLSYSRAELGVEPSALSNIPDARQSTAAGPVVVVLATDTGASNVTWAATAEPAHALLALEGDRASGSLFYAALCLSDSNVTLHNPGRTASPCSLAGVPGGQAFVAKLSSTGTALWATRVTLSPASLALASRQASLLDLAYDAASDAVVVAMAYGPDAACTLSAPSLPASNIFLPPPGAPNNSAVPINTSAASDSARYTTLLARLDGATGAPTTAIPAMGGGVSPRLALGPAGTLVLGAAYANSTHGPLVRGMNGRRSAAMGAGPPARASAAFLAAAYATHQLRAVALPPAAAVGTRRVLVNVGDLSAVSVACRNSNDSATLCNAVLLPGDRLDAVWTGADWLLY